MSDVELFPPGFGVWLGSLACSKVSFASSSTASMNFAVTELSGFAPPKFSSNSRRRLESDGSRNWLFYDVLNRLPNRLALADTLPSNLRVGLTLCGSTSRKGKSEVKRAAFSEL